MGAVKIKLLVFIERQNAVVKTFANFLVNAFDVLGEILGARNGDLLNEESPFATIA
tara:strand:+ start:143 stop:310 length:168 start_codon:yes stop_codon:yes gene_type:complete